MRNTDFDWADLLALDILVDARDFDMRQALKLIAARLRVVRVEGENIGVDRLGTALDNAKRERVA